MDDYIDDMIEFAGLSGGIEKKIQQGKALTGDESTAYQNYVLGMQAATTLAGQVRQFYGDSIQPAAQEKLKKLSNPVTWRNSPELAKKLYNDFKRLMLNETKTYRDAANYADSMSGKTMVGTGINQLNNRGNDPLGIR